MALTFSHWEAEVQLFDKGGNPTTRRFRMRNGDDTGTDTQVMADVQALVTDLLAVTDAVIKSIRVTKISLESAFALPTTGEVEDHALITAPIFGIPNKSASIDIPAPSDTIFVGAPGSGANYNLVDFTEVLVTNYLDNFTGAASIAQVSDGESISQTNLKGKRTHSKSTKG